MDDGTETLGSLDDLLTEFGVIVCGTHCMEGADRIEGACTWCCRAGNAVGRWLRCMGFCEG